MQISGVSRLYFKYYESLTLWTITDVARRVLSSANRSAESSTSGHLVLVRRCLVTPTRCMLSPPVLETSNEMLRDHAQHIDRFLRVQFVDDDGDFPVNGETLIIDDKLQGMEGVFARIRRALSDGIFIAGRHYVFATFSESQGRLVVNNYCDSLIRLLQYAFDTLACRERGCWMIAEAPPAFTVATILASMGDLSQERIVAKHAARQSLVRT